MRPLGDYGLLYSLGFKNLTILLLNSFGSFCSLASFFIISAVSPGSSIREWIFAITAAVFLYIALANMVRFFEFSVNLIKFKISSFRFRESKRFLRPMRWAGAITSLFSWWLGFFWWDGAECFCLRCLNTTFNSIFNCFAEYREPANFIT